MLQGNDWVRLISLARLCGVRRSLAPIGPSRVLGTICARTRDSLDDGREQRLRRLDARRHAPTPHGSARCVTGVHMIHGICTHKLTHATTRSCNIAHMLFCNHEFVQGQVHVFENTSGNIFLQVGTHVYFNAAPCGSAGNEGNGAHLEQSQGTAPGSVPCADLGEREWHDKVFCFVLFVTAVIHGICTHKLIHATTRSCNIAHMLFCNHEFVQGQIHVFQNTSGNSFASWHTRVF
jgi:hypothetical protein